MVTAVHDAANCSLSGKINFTFKLIFSTDLAYGTTINKNSGSSLLINGKMSISGFDRCLAPIDIRTGTFNNDAIFSGCRQILAMAIKAGTSIHPE